MYKRKTKSSSLGIVRSINKPIVQENPSHENSSPNTPRTALSKGVNSPTNITVCSTSGSKGRTKVTDAHVSDSLTKSVSSQEDPDEVLSDSEPSPKRSRSFLNSSSSISTRKSYISREEIVSSSNIKNLNSALNNKGSNKPTNNISKLSSSFREKAATQLKESSPVKVTASRLYPNNIKTGPDRNKTKKFSENVCRSYGTLMEEFFDKTGFILSDGNSSNILSKYTQRNPRMYICIRKVLVCKVPC